MITIDKVRTNGWEEAIRGARNSFRSWDKSDSGMKRVSPANWDFVIGENDIELLTKLAKGGSSESKYRRMITVYADITAPLYWWKQFDTYKVGTITMSTSTMHSVTDKEFDLNDFSRKCAGELELLSAIEKLNYNREQYLICKGNKNYKESARAYWGSIIELLPSSYNQLRTCMLNYEVLAAQYRDRKHHKLDEWKDYCEWIENLPHSGLITAKREKFSARQ